MTSPSENWYEIQEAHGSAGMAIILFLVHRIPGVILRSIAIPVGFFYGLCAKSARAAARHYLQQLNSALRRRGEKPVLVQPVRHIISFALLLTEKVAVWAGKFNGKHVHFSGDDVQELRQCAAQKKGCLLLISHAGNAELLRALVDHNDTGLSSPFRVNVVYDMDISGGFTGLLNRVDSHASFNIIDANNITPQTISFMQERLSAGEFVAIAGDRTSAHTNRFITQPFLDKPAHFSYGTFLLAALLNVPTYFVFAMRQKDITVRPVYTMSAVKNPVSFDCSRKEREERIKKTAAAFAQALEQRCLEHPYQWYNFFDFWAGAE